MAKLTDQEIIKYYEQRKQTLTQELNKVDAVLNALTANGSPGSLASVKKRPYTRRKPIEKKATRSSVRSASSQSVKTSTRKPAVALSPTSGAKGSWDSKIQDALSQLGSATKGSIVQFLAERDPSTSSEKINKALTLRLAILLKNGKLKGEQAGDEYQYSLA